LILHAFKLGCRLDAWEDHIRKDIWRSLLDSDGSVLSAENERERAIDAEFPWDSVFSGVGKKYLKIEYERSRRRELTPPCAADCTGPCGVCRDKDVSVVVQNDRNIEPVLPRVAC
jgi:hypothetical protein